MMDYIFVNDGGKMNFLYQIINIVYKKGKSVLLDVLIPSCQRYML
jgi:hypothetical protein